MANVKINRGATPSEQLIAKAAAEVTITDSRGRRILLKKPGVLAQFRLVEAIGDLAQNRTYMAMVLPLIYVASIDDAIVPPMSQKSHVEALIGRLDEDGIAAVAEGIAANFGVQTPEEDKAALKNS